MAFMNELEKKLNSETQCTENGAVGYRTSGKELLDLNFAVSSMRNWDENEICKIANELQEIFEWIKHFPEL